PATWGELTDFDDTQNHTPAQRCSFIGYLVEIWRDEDIVGPTLWSRFADEFGEWDEQHWAQVPPRMNKHLRTYLTANGVLIPMDGQRITANLEEAAKRTTFRDWSPNEIDEWKKRSKEFQRRMEDKSFAKSIQPLGTTSPLATPQPTPAI